MDIILFWLVIGSVVAIAIIGALCYACYNLLKKIEVYEEWVSRFRSEIDQVYKHLKEVDDKNLFDKDDDVGVLFTELLRITKEFDDTIK